MSAAAARRLLLATGNAHKVGEVAAILGPATLRGAEADIETLVLDSICGHSPGTKGNEYTRITLKKRIAAMKKFPRYVLAPSSQRQVAAE